MVRWSVSERIAKKGWTTPYRLAVETGISEPAAKRVFECAELSRIDLPTLYALADAFKVPRSRAYKLLEWPD